MHSFRNIVLMLQVSKNKWRSVMSEGLFKSLSIVVLPRIERFVTTEKFCSGEAIDGIQVDWIGAHFKENLSGDIEEAVSTAELCQNELRVSVNDSIILPFLGGSERVGVTLGQLWECLKTVDRRFWYVGYVRSQNGVLFGVHAGWMEKKGLSIESGPLNRGHGWGIGCRFLSPLLGTL